MSFLALNVWGITRESDLVWNVLSFQNRFISFAILFSNFRPSQCAIFQYRKLCSSPNVSVGLLVFL